MNMRIHRRAEELGPLAVTRRREFHRYAETGWLEMRTSAVIASVLTELGYEVLTGAAVCDPSARMGILPEEELRAHAELVRRQNPPSEYLTEQMEAGLTGVIGILRCEKPGPVTALRFDIDALGILEARTENHCPYREGFASVNPGMMHACGHDGHTAIGLGTAQILMEIKDQLTGTVKLIFQPAEEGVRGAKAIVKKGHLDDVDYFLAAHVAPPNEQEDGDITSGTYGSLATSKYDVTFEGRAAHAGGCPEDGRNALLSAAAAVMGLSAIPRHSKGASRVNVGTLHAGTGRNVIPSHAVMELEVRGETTQINQYMDEAAVRVCEAAAAMYGCTCKMEKVGEAGSQHSSPALAQRIRDLVRHCGSGLRISREDMVKSKESEDVSWMMNRVQERGGQAVYLHIVTPMVSPQHTDLFDFDEQALINGMEVFSMAVYSLMKEN